MLSYLLLFKKRLELNSIQNSHLHELSKLVENFQYLHTTTERKLTSNHRLKFKSLGYDSVFWNTLSYVSADIA